MYTSIPEWLLGAELLRGLRPPKRCAAPAAWRVGILAVANREDARVYGG
jgi:hypothetical protein